MMLRKEIMTPEIGWSFAVANPRRSAFTIVRSASFRILRPIAGSPRLFRCWLASLLGSPLPKPPAALATKRRVEEGENAASVSGWAWC
jgi:hypothetical protein